ncbi:CoA transferase [Nocardioides sp. BP30]|uniref:CoA transferase n=1 Tax=Nocardioides sp. BP30 TaxID=3036374 RepID=UPI00246865E0|nr:CoA transferase [Nocardioides sp. BP30]WGL54029.1 CoA transferase [Nocardioides sp. BP30]
MAVPEAHDPVDDWARSGAMALTGRPDGPPLLPPGRAASFLREQLAALGLALPGLLGERAAYAGFTRNAPWSCGGAFRILTTCDGHVGLSLARPSDVELVPALVEADAAEPWAAVAAWAETVPTAVAAERIRLLGLPGGAVPAEPTGPDEPDARSGVVATTLGRRTPSGPPLVVDLTSLWAGPLCAHLLGLRGARVVKVETPTRPDGARRGPAAFFELLHAGHDQISLELGSGELRRLLERADLVLEASRPRALRQAGIVAEEYVARGTSWLSITARGRASDAVGFGDDVAASAGLVVASEGELLPAGDAMADPLAGVAAAVAATEALGSEEARLIDVSMLHVAASTAGRTPDHQVVRRGAQWWVEYDGGASRVLPARTR